MIGGVAVAADWLDCCRRAVVLPVGQWASGGLVAGVSVAASPPVRFGSPWLVGQCGLAAGRWCADHRQWAGRFGVGWRRVGWPSSVDRLPTGADRPCAVAARPTGRFGSPRPWRRRPAVAGLQKRPAARPRGRVAGPGRRAEPRRPAAEPGRRGQATGPSCRTGPPSRSAEQVRRAGLRRPACRARLQRPDRRAVLRAGLQGRSAGPRRGGSAAGLQGRAAEGPASPQPLRPVPCSA